MFYVSARSFHRVIYQKPFLYNVIVYFIFSFRFNCIYYQTAHHKTLSSNIAQCYQCETFSHFASMRNRTFVSINAHSMWLCTICIPVCPLLSRLIIFFSIATSSFSKASKWKGRWLYLPVTTFTALKKLWT